MLRIACTQISESTLHYKRYKFQSKKTELNYVAIDMRLCDVVEIWYDTVNRCRKCDTKHVVECYYTGLMLRVNFV